MSQEQILKQATEAISQNNLDKVRQLLASTIETPDTDTVSAILKTAANYARWILVREIVKIQDINKPNQNAIDYALEQAFNTNNMDEFKFLCEQPDNRPSRKALETLLQNAHSGKYGSNWDFAEYLCLLNVGNKPGQESIDTAFMQAATGWKWELLRKIINKKEEPKPGENAIDHALVQAFNANNMDEFKFLCEQPDNKPSKIALETLLEKAHSGQHGSNWDFADYLCLLNVGNKPGQESIDQAFMRAATGWKWELVRKIINNKKGHNPGENAIDHALAQAFNANNLDEFKFLCEQPDNKPSQKALETLLEKAHSGQHGSNWDFADYLCLLNVGNKPGQESIDQAFMRAAASWKWELVRKIINNKTGHKPGENAIDHALAQAFNANNLDEFKFLCEQPDNKPGQKALETLLEKAHSGQHGSNWDFADYLCLLNVGNKPGQESIDQAFMRAAASWKWELVRKIINNKTGHKPGQSAIDYALERASDPNNLDEFKFLCEQPDNKPGQKALETLLENGHSGKYDLNWDLVDYLCLLNVGNKPGQESIDQAFMRAAASWKWELVKKIYQKEVTYTPGQLAIEHVLVQGAGANQIDIINDLCNLPADLRPRVNAIGNAFMTAAGRGHIDVVRFLAETDSDNKPLPEAFSKALLLAATNGKLEVVQYLCQLSFNQPNQQVIGEALLAAATNNHPQVVKFLCSKNNPVPPNQKAGNESFSKAISAGFVQLIHVFTDPDNEFQLEQATINDGLLEAIKAPFAFTIVPLLWNNNLPPSMDTIQLALSEVTDNRIPILCPFLELQIPLPSTLSQNEIATLLQLAVSDKNLLQVKKICALTGENNKPTIEHIEQALQNADTDDIRDCLRNARKILALHQHIATFRSYGETLPNESDNQFGDDAVELADQLKTMADNYATALFRERDIKPAQKRFIAALQQGHDKMAEHRNVWKIHLANIALAATGIGLLINYCVNGHAFFSYNTQRQNQVQTISNALDCLENKSYAHDR